MHALGQLDTGKPVFGSLMQMHKQKELVHRQAMHSRKRSGHIFPKLICALEKPENTDRPSIVHIVSLLLYACTRKLFAIDSMGLRF